MTTQRPQTDLGDELTNLGIGLLIGAAVLALLLRGSGSLAAWATGIDQPNGGPETGLAVLLDPGNPAAALRAPGLNPVAYWVTTIVLVGMTSALAFALWRVFRGVTTKVDPYRIAGIAPLAEVARAEVARAASHPAIMKRAAPSTVAREGWSE